MKHRLVKLIEPPLLSCIHEANMRVAQSNVRAAASYGGNRQYSSGPVKLSDVGKKALKKLSKDDSPKHGGSSKPAVYERCPLSSSSNASFPPFLVHYKQLEMQKIFNPILFDHKYFRACHASPEAGYMKFEKDFA